MVDEKAVVRVAWMVVELVGMMVDVMVGLWAGRRVVESVVSLVEKLECELAVILVACEIALSQGEIC